MKYIPDREIDLTEQGDLLGTMPYAFTLADIITKCETPFTIGVFGGWGSGKSSIVKTVKHLLKNDHENIGTYLYDAWKYSQDSFRREFILGLKNEFSLDTTQDFDSFYSDKHEDIGHTLVLRKHPWVNLMVLGPLILLGIWFFNSPTPSLKIVTTIVGVFLTALCFLLKESFVKYKISITRPKVFAPEQFETMFSEIIEKLTVPNSSVVRWIKELLTGRKTYEKIVIIIDNIDRCHSELAKELLLTIKNFLEIEKVVFILPVDEEGVKNYLSPSSQDASEFLRKLFTTTMRLRQLSNNELYDFCEKLNAAYKLDLPTSVLSLIAQEFSRSPRRIIQFLNNMITEVALASQQEHGNTIRIGTISRNLPMLAKLMIVREEWPDLYNRLRYDLSLLGRLDRGFKEDAFEYGATKGTWTFQNKYDPLEFTTDQYRFLLRTHHIHADAIEPFFVNKDVYQDIPDEIRDMVVSQDWNSMKQLMIDGNATFDRLIQFITSQFDTDVLKREQFETTGYNVVSLLLKILKDPSYKDDFERVYIDGALDKIKSGISMRGMQDLIFKFDAPADLLLLARTMHADGFDGLLHAVVVSIQKLDPSQIDEPTATTLVGLVKGLKDFPEIFIRIRDHFSQIVLSCPRFNSIFRDVLIETGWIDSLIVNRGTINEMIITIHPRTAGNQATEYVETLGLLNSGGNIPPDLSEKYVGTILPFLSTNNFENNGFWLKSLSGFIPKVASNITLLELIFNMLREHWLQVSEFAQQSSRPSALSDVVHKLADVTEGLLNIRNQFASEVSHWISDIIRKANLQDVSLTTNSLACKMVESLPPYQWPFFQVVVDRFSRARDWAEKKAFGDTVAAMLARTSTDAGCNENQIGVALNEMFAVLDVYNQRAIDITDWFRRVADNPAMLAKLTSKAAELQRIELVLKVVSILKNVGKDDPAIVVCRTVLKRALEQGFLKEFFDKLNQSDVGPEVVRPAITEAVRASQIHDNEVLKALFELVKPDIHSYGEDFIEATIDKLKPMLVSQAYSDIAFAIAFLSYIKNVPQGKKEVLKTLLKDTRRDELSEDEKGVLKQLIKRMS